MIMRVPTSDFSTFGSGLGDVLSDAQRLLTQAGYQGVSCRTERVYFPGIDPNTGKDYYEQNICSAPGVSEGFSAEAVTNSTLAHPGYGVDLAAERAYLQRNDPQQDFGHERSYFDDYSGPLTQVLAQVNADQTRTTNAAAPPPDVNAYIKTMDAAAAQRASTGSPAPKGADTNTAGGSATVSGSGSSASFLDGLKSIDPLYLYAGLAAVAALVVLPMLSKGGR